MQVFTYKPKRLIDGRVVGKEGMYVAIPGTHKNKKIVVDFDGKVMIINNWNRAEAYRRFPDKWGRGMYTLGYFKFQPEGGEKENGSN